MKREFKVGERVRAVGGFTQGPVGFPLYKQNMLYLSPSVELEILEVRGNGQLLVRTSQDDDPLVNMMAEALAGGIARREGYISSRQVVKVLKKKGS